MKLKILAGVSLVIGTWVVTLGIAFLMGGGIPARVESTYAPANPTVSPHVEPKWWIDDYLEDDIVIPEYRAWREDDGIFAPGHGVGR